ncbi:MAG: 16S rRNA (uracil(1498)-N(3))-methyltransferase [Defluviitaleaceae bacterium]|nr:16S rRNA (uracil(1498)-N(3))-methyltransferase [Defluviitaleaceae bacterium]
MRFFVKQEQISENKIIIDGDDVKHIKDVLRLKTKDILTVCNGNKIDYTCSITEILQKEIKLEIINQMVNQNETEKNIFLFQGLPKSTKSEIIIQKTVELGISSINLIETDHSVPKFKDFINKHTKMKRLEKIVKAAAMQSERGIIPEIKITTIEQVFENFNNKNREIENFGIIAYENEKENKLKKVLQNLKEEKQNYKNISIFIGPEGGFSKGEIDKATNLGIQKITLGSRILKTETAAITTLALVMYEMEEM